MAYLLLLIHAEMGWKLYRGGVALRVPDTFGRRADHVTFTARTNQTCRTHPYVVPTWIAASLLVEDFPSVPLTAIAQICQLQTQKLQIRGATQKQA